MKKGYVKLLIISLILAIVSIINAFTGIFSLYTFTLFLLASFLVTRYLMGFESDRFHNKKEIIIIIIGAILLYYAITYVTVFFWGILQSVFVLNWNTFINNVFPLFLIIILTELLRFIIIRKGRGYKSIWIIAVIVFTLIDISLKTRGYNFSESISVVKFSLEIVATSLAKNIFLCYLINRTGYKVSILFRMLFDMPLYLLPFFPNLGIFIDSVAKILLPNIILLILIFGYSRYDEDEEQSRGVSRQFIIIRRFALVLLAIFVIGVVALSSARFKLFSIVVGSGSMEPYISKGDVVIVNRIENFDEIEEGDVLIFEQEDSSIIHRVVRVETENNIRRFITRGDANEAEDYYPVSESEVIGIGMFKIKFIGLPTIWINEAISR